MRHTVLYHQMSWVWVSSYYDVPLDGLCRWDGALCSFEIIDVEAEPPLYRVAVLTWLERVRWLARKWLFELCVGRHWSYPQREQGVRYHLRSPAWFWRAVNRAYYWRYRKGVR